MSKLIEIIAGIFLLYLTACQQNPAENQAHRHNVQEAHTISETDELPGNSIYHFDYTWTDSHDQTVQLADFKGRPVVISMIYTHCGYACPMMIQDLKNIASEFDSNQTLPFELVLISFDHIRDTPERLHSYASAQQLSDQWHLLHGNADQIKDMAVALGISFEMTEDGDIAHSNRKILLDKNGVVVYTVDGLSTPAIDFAQKIKTI